jgi:hypothetical protein
MTIGKNTLLVEGTNDQAFFKKLCDTLNLKVEIKVATPTDMIQKAFNSKQGVLNVLNTILPMLEDENSSIQQLAIVLDADITGNNNGGFAQTITDIKDKAFKYGYSKTHKYCNGGIKIEHDDAGMQPLWVWIMPNNKDDGTIENLIKEIMHLSETDLFNKAHETVKSIKNHKFSKESIVKAEIATWLAWQKQPGRTPAYTLKDSEKLIDIEHINFMNLKKWLSEAFNGV